MPYPPPLRGVSLVRTSDGHDLLVQEDTKSRLSLKRPLFNFWRDGLKNLASGFRRKWLVEVRLWAVWTMYTTF
jgi:hypothetical protein